MRGVESDAKKEGGNNWRGIKVIRERKWRVAIREVRTTRIRKEGKDRGASKYCVEYWDKKEGGRSRGKDEVLGGTKKERGKEESSTEGGTGIKEETRGTVDRKKDSRERDGRREGRRKNSKERKERQKRVARMGVQ